MMGGIDSAGRVEELREERDLLLASVSDPVFYVSEIDQQIVEANAAAAALTGCSLARLRGLPLGRFLRSSRSSTIPESGDSGVSARCLRPGEIKHRDDSWAPVWWASAPLTREGTRVRMVVAHPGVRGASPAGPTRPAIEPVRSAADPANAYSAMLGRCERIRTVCRIIGQVARTDSTVLVEGENGTGKEVVARTIHQASRRADKPFVKVNCAGLPESLLESELFGHVRGAFTGAIRARTGRFREADSGTILLDEIGTMSLGGQARLLRVLQERELEPVGSSTPLRIDIRVIATTNVNLRKAASSGEFREDLYYRLSVVTLCLPPLREREGDIPLLAESFLRMHSERLGRHVRGFSDEAMDLLQRYTWPGNVRELENAVEHAVVLAEGDRIRADDLPQLVRESGDPCGVRAASQMGLRERLNGFERRLLLETLRNANWVRKAAAQNLGIDPKNFNYFLRKHHIEPSVPPPRHSSPACSRAHP